MTRPCQSKIRFGKGYALVAMAACVLVLGLNGCVPAHDDSGEADSASESSEGLAQPTDSTALAAAEAGEVNEEAPALTAAEIAATEIAETEIAVADEKPRPPPPTPIVIDPDPDHRPQFNRPESVRGIYLNAWASGSSVRSRKAIELAHRTEINAFVIDVKDVSGFVSYATTVPFAREVGAHAEVRIRDIQGLLRRLEAAEIYPIARIVMVRDPILTEARPDLAIQDTAGGAWKDGRGESWANLFSPEVRAYYVALAVEAAQLGFPEVQFDYVRFPDAPRAELSRSVHPSPDGSPRTSAVSAFLDEAREALADYDMDITADVFGVTTMARNDVGIGQRWEDFIERVDVALPMVYPSHYWTGSFGIEHPNAHPYTIVREAIESGLRRSAVLEAPGRIRPWLQDFNMGEPSYSAAEVRAQIQGAYDAGVNGWLLWNPSSRYTEAALEPVSGYPDGWEPVMRVGGTVVPVSQRFEALAREEEQKREDERLRTLAEADSSGVGN